MATVCPQSGRRPQLLGLLEKRQEQLCPLLRKSPYV